MVHLRRLYRDLSSSRASRTHWLDSAYGIVAGRPRLYADGWGDLQSLEELVRYLHDPGVPAALSPEMRRVGDSGGARTFEGRFESPAPLPPPCRTAHFQLVLPDQDDAAPVLVILAASRDEGYTTRRRTYLPLLREGLGVLFLESPFYGQRRPPGQVGADLRQVADQYALCRGAIEEAVALLGFLQGRGHRAVGVGGYSMGGSMAGFAAACAPFPIAVALGATSTNGATIASRDLLSRQFHWDRLGDDPLAARRKVYEQCTRVSMDLLPPPVAPHAAVLVGCTRDGYVDPDGIRALHAHWAGSTLRWLEAGHISGVLFHAAALRQAAVDAFTALRTGRPPPNRP